MTQASSLVSFKDINRDMVETINNGFNVHDHLKSLSVEQLYELNQQDRLPFQVMALSLTGDMNIGNIIRTSLLQGAEKVYIYGRRKIDARGSVGSQNYIDVDRIYGFEGDGNDLTFDVNRFREILQENNLYPVFVEQGGLTLGQFKWTDLPLDGKKILLVLGNETNGIPQSFLDLQNELNGTTVSIPQRGVVRSFNVGTAMAIVSWDLRVGMSWL